MSHVTLDEARAYLRQLPSSDLDDVLQNALASAESQVENFIGQSLDAFDTELPAPIHSAVLVLTQIEVDELAPLVEQQRRARVESLLRPYRIETGLAAAGGVA